MTLNRLKFRDKSIEDLLDDIMEECYNWGYDDSYTDFLETKSSAAVKEIKQRFREKSEKIIRLNMEHDRFRSRRQGEIW